MIIPTKPPEHIKYACEYLMAYNEAELLDIAAWVLTRVGQPHTDKETRKAQKRAYYWRKKIAGGSR